MKLTKTTENKLAKEISHITGECMCKASSNTCTYWKNVDGENGWQTKAIIKLIKQIKLIKGI